MTENMNSAFAARGDHGQIIHVVLIFEMVIVRIASHPIAENAANDPTSHKAYQAFAYFLKAMK